MITNSLLIYTDEEDPDLKNYFKDCADRISTIFEGHSGVHLTIEEGGRLYDNSVNLSECVFQQFQSPIFLLILSHGSESGFYRYKASQTPFLSIEPAIPNCLSNGVLYSVACLTGKKFGTWLGSHEGSFFGYFQSVTVVYGEEKTYAYLDSLGAHYILTGKTLKEVKSLMQAAYTLKIDESISNIFLASALRKARDSICIHGRTDHRFF